MAKAHETLAQYHYRNLGRFCGPRNYAVGIDLDERNAVLAEQRVGGFFFERVGVVPEKEGMKR